MRRALLSEVTLMLPILRLVVGEVVVDVVVVVAVVISWWLVEWLSLLFPPSSGSSHDPVLCGFGSAVAKAEAACRLIRRALASALVQYFSLW